VLGNQPSRQWGQGRLCVTGVHVSGTSTPVTLYGQSWPSDFCEAETREELFIID
jgi:hypothetical protein